MSDVPRLAGVSRITVSRVYREPDSVSEKTRRKVEAAAAAINFVPDRMTGALRSGVANSVAALARFLDGGISADAYFGAGDVFALSALMEARRRGMSIPGDLASASFDDHDICQFADPRLTSIHIPRFAIGTCTADIKFG